MRVRIWVRAPTRIARNAYFNIFFVALLDPRSLLHYPDRRCWVLLDCSQTKMAASKASPPQPVSISPSSSSSYLHSSPSCRSGSPDNAEICSPSKSPLSPAASAAKRLQNHPSVNQPRGARRSSRESSISTPRDADIDVLENLFLEGGYGNRVSTIPAPVPSSKPSAGTTKKILERNQACLSCRQRKRKCDGAKPKCGACSRLCRECIYTNNTTTKIHSSSRLRGNQSSALPTRRVASNSGTRASTSYNTPVTTRMHTSSTRHSSQAATNGPLVTPAPRTIPPHMFIPVQANESATLPPPTATSSVLCTRPSPISTRTRTRATSTPSPRVMNCTSTSNRKRTFSERNPSLVKNSNKKPTITHTCGSNISNVGIFSSFFLQAPSFRGLEFINMSPLVAEKAPSENADCIHPILTEEGLPGSELTAKLFNVFFEKCHSTLPCLYKTRVMEDAVSDGLLTKPNTLTYAILSLAGYLDSDTGIKAASDQWASLAQERFHRGFVSGNYTMLNIQGGIYICLRMLGLGQFSELWMFMALVWRMCIPLGFNQIDRNVSGINPLLPQARSEQELEERRRTVWAIYILDRLSTAASPFTSCIEDRMFCVNFPAPEETFQNGSMENMERMVIDPFPSDLESLSPPYKHADSVSPDKDAYQYLCKIAVLVGRIDSYNRCLHRKTSLEFQQLEVALARFQINVPQKYHRPWQLSPAELPTVFLLICVMRMCTVWLHFPQCNPEQFLVPNIITNDGNGSRKASFDFCVGAIHNVVSFLSSVVGLSDERVFSNPLLGPSFLLGARILTLKYHDERANQEDENSAATSETVHLILDVLKHMRRVWPVLAEKYMTLVTAWLEKDRPDIFRKKADDGGISSSIIIDTWPTEES